MGKGRYFRQIVRYIFILSILISILPGYPVRAGKKDDKWMTIVLDPGHGGVQSGAEREDVYEKSLNLKIGEYLRRELEKYENVKVYLTRESDRDVELDDRSQFCLDVDADLMVSLHNNAAGETAAYHNGSTVLTSMGQYHRELALEEQELAVNILAELSGLGLEDQGILLRLSKDGATYPNGETADYYRLVKNGIKNKIPSIIVEHAFMDNDEEYAGYLSEDEQLKKLAEADARGIARYYGLTLKEDGSRLETLGATREKLVQVVDDDYRHNIVTYKIFFQDTSQEGSTIHKEQPEEATGTAQEENHRPARDTENSTHMSRKENQKQAGVQKKSKEKNGSVMIKLILIIVLSGILLLVICRLLMLLKRDKPRKK